MAAEEEYYVFTGLEAVPRHVTRVRIDESISVIPTRAFYNNRNIAELDCHIGVKKVKAGALFYCRSLRIVIMPGVEEVEGSAFHLCKALTDIECGKLEIIGHRAFGSCISLRSINLPSAKIVHGGAFINCTALTRIRFGKELESIRSFAFGDCTSLERITLQLKVGMITDDDIFQGCKQLKHVDLFEGAILHEIIAALQMEEWGNHMNEEIDVINQILSTTPAGGIGADVGGKAVAIRAWITNVLLNIIRYKAQHHRHLKEHANTLELALWKKRLSEINAPEGDDEGRAECRVKCSADIVMKNVLPFLELPPYMFEGED
jgi:hypothetical protein